jgi:hypothetical protein
MLADRERCDGHLYVLEGWHRHADEIDVALLQKLAPAVAADDRHNVESGIPKIRRL